MEIASDAAHGVIVEEIPRDPKLRHVYFDISWDEVAKYLLDTPETMRRSAAMINRYPDRFLFGSDVVAPRDTAQYAGREREGWKGQLRAAVRRGTPARARVGEGTGTVAKLRPARAVSGGHPHLATNRGGHFP
jgi:hypothetical protein